VFKEAQILDYIFNHDCVVTGETEFLLRRKFFLEFEGDQLTDFLFGVEVDPNLVAESDF